MADDTFNLSDLLAPALQVGSTILTAGAQIAKGQAAKKIAARRQVADEYEAKQLEIEGAQSRGVGMRAAQDQIVNTEMVNSTALARAAASGAGASDPTVTNVIARTAGAGAYRALLATYEGEAQARLDMAKAGALRYEGATGVSDAATAARMAGMTAGTTLLSGAVKGLSMYEKYYAGPTPAAATNTTTMPTVTSGRGNGSWLQSDTPQITDPLT